MRASFPALIFFFRDTKNYYAVMGVGAYQRFSCNNSLEYAHRIDSSSKVGLYIFKHKLDSLLRHNENRIILICVAGSYVIMPIDDFKEILHGSCEES